MFKPMKGLMAGMALHRHSPSCVEAALSILRLQWPGEETIVTPSGQSRPDPVQVQGPGQCFRWCYTHESLTCRRVPGAVVNTLAPGVTVQCEALPRRHAHTALRDHALTAWNKHLLINPSFILSYLYNHHQCRRAGCWRTRSHCSKQRPACRPCCSPRRRWGGRRGGRGALCRVCRTAWRRLISITQFLLVSPLIIVVISARVSLWYVFDTDKAAVSIN